MSLWDTIDELLGESTNVTIQNDNAKKNESAADEKIYDDNELDQNEVLGLEYEEDDLGILGDQIDTVEEKTKAEENIIVDEQKPSKKQSCNQSFQDEEMTKTNTSSKSSKYDEKKTNEKSIEKIRSPVKHSRIKEFKPRAQMGKNFPKNDGILPIPTHYMQSSNLPTQNFNMPNLIYPQIPQFSNQQFNFNEIYRSQVAPYQHNSYPLFDQGYMFSNYPYPNQPVHSSFQNEMRIPINQFVQQQPQFNHYKANDNFTKNSKYLCESKTLKSEKKEEVVSQKAKSSRSKKELNLLLEKRLAALEKERIEEEKIEQSVAKRKPESSEIKHESKSESESLILAQDPDYIKKMEEQKRKREEILRLKEEKRNQRIKQKINEKNENIPEDKPNSSSDNRIIKTSSKRLIALNSADKKIFDMSNSIGVRAKVNHNFFLVA